jgi:hypothetical protein
MKPIMTVLLLGPLLAGCGGTPEHRLLSPDGTGTAVIEDLIRPGVRDASYKDRQKATEAADDTKCRDLGFKPGTEPYGNCRLQVAQIRATNRAAAATQSAASGPSNAGLSFMCKDAIARGDSGATQTFC